MIDTDEKESRGKEKKWIIMGSFCKLIIDYNSSWFPMKTTLRVSFKILLHSFVFSIRFILLRIMWGHILAIAGHHAHTFTHSFTPVGVDNSPSGMFLGWEKTREPGESPHKRVEHVQNLA